MTTRSRVQALIICAQYNRVSPALTLGKINLFCWQAPPSEGTGRAIVTLRRYTNPSHRLSNGKCCDHRFLNIGRCRPCDAYFKLCVSQAVSGSSSNSCNIGRSQTGVVGDDDNHVLNIRRAFSFESFKVSTRIKQNHFILVIFSASSSA